MDQTLLARRADINERLAARREARAHAIEMHELAKEARTAAQVDDCPDAVYDARDEATYRAFSTLSHWLWEVERVQDERDYLTARLEATGGVTAEVTPENILPEPGWQRFEYALWNQDTDELLYAADDIGACVHFSQHMPDDVRAAVQQTKGRRRWIADWWREPAREPDYPALIADRLACDSLLGLIEARALAHERDALAAQVAWAEANGY